MSSHNCPMCVCQTTPQSQEEWLQRFTPCKISVDTTIEAEPIPSTNEQLDITRDAIAALERVILYCQANGIQIDRIMYDEMGGLALSTFYNVGFECTNSGKIFKSTGDGGIALIELADKFERKP